MIQVIFFALLIVTLLGGFIAYYAPAQKPVSPMGFMMDQSGYNSVETVNRKKSQQINMTTSRGLLQIRRQMDDLALEQKKFMDTIQDQQQILDSTNKDAHDILLEAQAKGQAGDKDILQLQALTSEMQDQQRLLVDRGQDLVSLNNQLMKNRQMVAEQIDLADINTESSLHSLQQRYASLNSQASDFFDKVAQYNGEVQDRMNQMQDKLNSMANTSSAVQQQDIKEHIQRMMDREHEDMAKLAEAEERSKDLLEDAKQKQEDSKELLNDKMQQNQDLIEKERQAQEDQQSMIRQRITDQEQRIQDQQAQRNQ